MIKAVLFDLDGVLLHHPELHHMALNKALKRYGYTITDHEHHTIFDGLPTKKKLAMLTTLKGLPDDLYGPISDLKQKYTQELIKVMCKPNQEHIELINHLKRTGYKLAICSNSIRATIDAFTEVACLNGYFDVILSNEDVTEPKPSPEIYDKAIELLGIKPNEALILEDNEYGIKAAKASGAQVVVIDQGPEQITREFIKSFL